MHHGILAGKQDGGSTEYSIDACTDVVGNSCNLATESNKLLNHRDNSLMKINLTFKRGSIVLKKRKSAVIQTVSLTLKPERQTRRQDRSHVLLRLVFTGDGIGVGVVRALPT